MACQMTSSERCSEHDKSTSKKSVTLENWVNKKNSRSSPNRCQAHRAAVPLKEHQGQEHRQWSKHQVHIEQQL